MDEFGRLWSMMVFSQLKPSHIRSYILDLFDVFSSFDMVLSGQVTARAKDMKILTEKIDMHVMTRYSYLVDTYKRRYFEPHKFNFSSLFKLL